MTPRPPIPSRLVGPHLDRLQFAYGGPSPGLAFNPGSYLGHNGGLAPARDGFADAALRRIGREIIPGAKK